MAGDLGSLGAGFRQAHDKIGEAQGAVGVARDRHDEALRLVAGVSDGSNNELVSAALAKVASADEALESVLGMYQEARDKINEYLGQKGI